MRLAVSRAGGLITVTGTENDLRNLNVNAGSLAQGGTQIQFGQNPVRRVLSLKEARIILSGHLKIDPEKETLIIGSDAPSGTGTVGQDGAGGAIEVRNGGHLEVGTSDATGSDGTTYSVGDAIIVARRGTNASDVATAALYGMAGSSVTLRGCSLNTVAACRFDALNASPARAACVLRIRDVVWYNGRDQATSYFAPRLYTSDYQIDGLKMVGGTLQIQARASGSFIRNIEIERMGGGISVTGGNFGSLTDFFELKGVDGNHDSTTDVSVFNGMKARITNSRTGSGIKADLQALNHTARAFGCIEVRQEVRLVLRDAAGNPIAGARAHLADTVTGRGAEDWTAKNAGPNGGGSPSALVNYTAQRTYSVVSDAAGNADFTADGGILLASKVYNSRPAAGSPHAAKAFAFRGKINNDSDTFDIHVNSYLHLPALLSVVCKGTDRVDVDVTLVADPSVSQTTVATVAAYSGIAVDHATDTVTITAPFTLDQLYDWLKRDKTLAGSETHPTRAGMVAMAAGTILDIGGYSLSVGNGGALNPGVKFNSIESTATISSTGTGAINVGYQDSAGKSVLVRLGAPQTAIVYDTGGADTYVAPSASDTARITVPANATLNITAKRVGYDYRKYSAVVADISEVAVDLPRNLNVETGAVVDGSNIATQWREDGSGVYGGNIYFDKAASIPHTLRLGNVELTSRSILTRSLFDRRMTSQAALEATHDHDDTGGRAYDIRNNLIVIDERWLAIGRQPITVPPNPATGSGALNKLATWGLYVVQRDGLTAYVPDRTGNYFVVIDPLATQFVPTARDLKTAADAALGDVEPELSAIRDDISAVAAELGRITPDLFATVSDLHVIPIAGGMDFGTYTGVTFAADATAWTWTWSADAAVTPKWNGAVASLPNARSSYVLQPAAGARVVVQIVLEAQSDTGEELSIDPNVRIQTSGTNAAGEAADFDDYTPPTGGPVRLRAPAGSFGPPVTAEWDLPPNVGSPANYDDFDIQINASGQGACRIRVTSVKFIQRVPADIADFRADVSVLEARLTAARALLLDNLSRLDADVSSRLAASGYTAPPSLSTLEGRLTAARAGNLDRLDATVSSRLAASGYTAPPSLSTLEGRLTAARAGNLDRLDATVSSRLEADDYADPPSAGEVARDVWEASLSVYDDAGSMGQAINRLFTRLDAAVSSRAAATAVETIRQVLLADIEVTDTNIIFRYNNVEIARFSRRSATTTADWSGGRE